MSGLDTTLDHYRDKYKHVSFERDDAGVLTVTFHTNGESLVWSGPAHEELGYAFADIGADRDNAVVILTGTGDDYCAEIDFGSFKLATARDWDLTFYEGRRLLVNLLDIEVPVIAAVNGPARMHPEIPAISDLVVMSETALFQDGPHFAGGIVPGDGAHVVWPHVLGPNRGRAFLLTNQEIDAATALSWGLAYDVVPAGQALARAKELAADVAAKPFLARRYARVVLTQRIKRLLHEGLSFGLALESLAVIDMLAGSAPAGDGR